ncbi:MAG: Fe-S cluster assembly transcriptional regulator IscR [Betaproteobacteria bacterium]|nr:Fe-S cluster assembly transcriptional regulator IscR [Betaproteobacteria bacterium]
MRLTTKGRFAVTALIDLALHHQQGPVTLAAISERQKISLSYLEQLFGKLRRRKLVESVRGPGGGYLIETPFEDITVGQIIRAVDEPMDATQCGGKQDCQGEERPCMTHELWSNLNTHIRDYLETVTLASLVNAQLAKKDRCAKLSQEPQAAKVTRMAETA